METGEGFLLTKHMATHNVRSMGQVYGIIVTVQFMCPGQGCTNATLGLSLQVWDLSQESFLQSCSVHPSIKLHAKLLHP